MVYKIDRLTRSLTDFSKMIPVRAPAHFVSVTQQFNSHQLHGAVELNILLSFAQVRAGALTLESGIRDKFAPGRE